MDLLRKLPIRIILSVIAGIATSAILSIITHEILHLCGVLPPLRTPLFDTGLLWLILAYHSIYAVVGAYITAMAAQDKARKAVIFLGTKGAVMWLLGAVLLWKHHPAWFNITKAILGVPLALLGGKIYEMYPFKKDQGLAIAKRPLKEV